MMNGKDAEEGNSKVRGQLQDTNPAFEWKRTINFGRDSWSSGEISERNLQNKQKGH